MGGLFSRDVGLIVFSQHLAGSTTLVNKIRENYLAPQVVGFAFETVMFNKGFTKFCITILCFPIDNEKLRPFLLQHLINTHCIIVVIDATKRSPTEVEYFHKALKHLMEDPESQGKPIVFAANKSDCSEAMSTEEIDNLYHLVEICDGRAWAIIKTCALNGDGLDELLDWATADH